MKKALFAFLTASSLISCGGGGGGGSTVVVPEPPPAPPAGTIGDGRLPELVTWARDAYGLPAMATIIVRNGQVEEATAEGLRSLPGGSSATIQDRWHVGSLTKAMTASLAGVLVEMSVLDWETTPLDVWPELDQAMHPSFKNVTLRQLLSHTAGVRRVNAAPPEYEDAAPGTVVEKRRSFAADLLSDVPVAPVGQASYSNGGYIIAGAMMETLMSAPWENLMQDYLFAALSMTSSGFGAPGDSSGSPQPVGHWPQGTGFIPVTPGPDADNPQVFGPAGTAHSSLGDYANFMLAHIAGARGVDGFVTSETFDILHEPVDNGSALGWGVSTNDAAGGVLQLSHAGSNQRWYAVVRLFPDHGVGGLFVTNAGGDIGAAGVAALENLIGERVSNSL